MKMRDATRQIETKMEAAGLSAAAIRAFLYQYRKLEHHEAGLIPEDSIAPIAALPSIDEQLLPCDTSDLVGQTVVLKLNGGLGTSMGLEKAKSLLKVRGELTFLDVIVRQFLRLRETVDRVEELVAFGLPSLIRCRSLTVSGKVQFEAGVEVVGDVKFVSRSNDTKRVTSGVYQDSETEL